MSEAGMRRNLVNSLASLDALAIESPSTGLGIPDVNFIGGWIECKWLRAWPKGAETNPIRFPHPLMPAQMVWLRRRALKGGLALVACQVSREWFFFDGLRIKELWHQMTRPEMVENSVLYMPNGLNKTLLLSFLSSKSET